jgi:hypothetical protein
MAINLLNPDELKSYLERLKQELVEKFTSNDIVQQIVKVNDVIKNFENKIKGYSIIAGLLYLLVVLLLFYIIYLISKK